MNNRLVVLCVSAVFALVSLCAQAQTAEQPRDPTKSVKRRTPPTIETAKVEEVLRVDDNGFEFVAYVVLWNEHRIVVEDPMVTTTYRVGDDITFAVMRHQVSRNPDKKILAFIVVPDSACRPAPSDAGSPSTNGAPCAGQEPRAPVPPANRSPEGAAADQILRNMTEAYAALQSYSDRGVVILHLEDDSEEIRLETTFETAFSRPSLFRFSWASQRPGPSDAVLRSVVWSDGAATYTRRSTDHALNPSAREEETEEDESLSMAIAGATGVSGGSAHTVPRLLMPEISGFSLGDLTLPMLVGVEAIEGIPCHHLVGEAPFVERVDVWIGVKDYLVRKVALPDSEEIRRDIRVNEAISAERFSPDRQPPQPVVPPQPAPTTEPQA